MGESAYEIDPLGGDNAGAAAKRSDAARLPAAEARESASASSRNATATSLRPAALSLVVAFEATPAGMRMTLARTAEAPGDTGEVGIRLEVPDTNGSWYARGRFLPGLEDGLFGLAPTEPRFRYVCLSGYDLMHVASPVQSASGLEAVVGATHSRLGDVTAQVITDGAVAIADGESLVVQYAATNVVAGALGWYALASRTTGSASTAWRRPTTEAVTPVPVAFALHQNQPNPFGRGTTIRFDLPVKGPVTLEVFDLQGRKVRTLARNTPFKPGFHAMTWDGRNDHGHLQRAGIYLYRFRAATFSSQRKMTLVP